ncbi:MAG: ribonuclease M5 [Fusobacteriaceae bacterium]|nr:ribonuclease M5 [Fusobacteriaceae bacterium]
MNKDILDNIQKKIIKEIIVVEGKDDISAVKAAVDAEVIEVNGFAVKKETTLKKIKVAYENKGIIILTDPDFAGDSIRKTLNTIFPNAKNAFISREEGTKGDDIGVENATPTAIIEALTKARYEVSDKKNTDNLFDTIILMEYGLVGCSNSSVLRAEVGKRLGIGYANAKQFLSRLNKYGIQMNEFLEAIPCS